MDYSGPGWKPSPTDSRPPNYPGKKKFRKPSLQFVSEYQLPGFPDLEELRSEGVTKVRNGIHRPDIDALYALALVIEFLDAGSSLSGAHLKLKIDTESRANPKFSYDAESDGLLSLVSEGTLVMLSILHSIQACAGVKIMTEIDTDHLFYTGVVSFLYDNAVRPTQQLFHPIPPAPGLPLPPPAVLKRSVSDPNDPSVGLHHQNILSLDSGSQSWSPDAAADSGRKSWSPDAAASPWNGVEEKFGKYFGYLHQPWERMRWQKPFCMVCRTRFWMSELIFCRALPDLGIF